MPKAAKLPLEAGPQVAKPLSLQAAAKLLPQVTDTSQFLADKDKLMLSVVVMSEFLKAADKSEVSLTTNLQAKVK